MKKILIASSLLVAMTGIAAAADLPLRTAPPVFAPPPLPIFTWTGAYFGINAGYAFSNESRFTNFGNTAVAQASIDGGYVPGTFRTKSDGFTGGGQIGYNYQFGAGSGIVVGLEADAAYTDLSRSGSYTNIDPVFGTTTTGFRSKLDYLGTVRGRIGYAFNQFLIYGTGGFAYGEVENNITATNTFLGTVGSGSDRTRTGYTYGGGIEYALPTSSFLNFFKSSAVTIKAEYLHYDLGRNTLTTFAPNGIDSVTSRIKTDGDLARVGLNYKFGSY